jgi:glutaredoxin
MRHTITVLHVPGCTGGAAALALAARIAAARDDVAVAELVVEDEETALASGFRGSPTVLIDGRDLEPDTEIPPGSMG